METLFIRFTRPDETTQPGGFIMRKATRSDGSVEYVVHTFNRNPGSRLPREFFWGRYCTNYDDAVECFMDKVQQAWHYTTGGSLIPQTREDYEIKQEMSDA